MAFQFITLGLLLGFYGCYFGKMLRQRRRGIRTDQMGKGKSGPALHIERTLKAATILVVLGEAVSILLNLTALPAWLRWIGVILTALGPGVFVTSVVTMRDSWRAGVPETDKTDLITGGVYRFSRNPAFLGFDLVYIGVLLTFCSWWLALLSAFAVVRCMCRSPAWRSPSCAPPSARITAATRAKSAAISEDAEEQTLFPLFPLHSSAIDGMIVRM